MSWLPATRCHWWVRVGSLQCSSHPRAPLGRAVKNGMGATVIGETGGRDQLSPVWCEGRRLQKPVRDRQNAVAVAGIAVALFDLWDQNFDAGVDKVIDKRLVAAAAGDQHHH